MNQGIKQRWVEALRSGEFEQGKLFLRVRDTFCCLGVLSELAVRDGVIAPSQKCDPDMGDIYAYDQHTACLPEAVADWAGLLRYSCWEDREVPDVSPKIAGVDLADLNDEGVEFAKLADLIEENL